MRADSHERSLRGLIFTRQYPNRAEPLRGNFVAEQVEATAGVVDWRVIAPLAWPPRVLRALVPHLEAADGLVVERPRYPVLPRRILYGKVASTMARRSSHAFARAILVHDPQFVHAHELYPSGAAAATLCASSGVPLIVSVHGSDLYTNIEHPTWWQWLSLVVDQATAIVAVSSSLADDLASEFPRAKAKTVVIPDTYDAARFRFVDRAPHGGPVRLLSVGRLSAEKGFAVLVSALARARARGLDFQARIVGGGAEAAYLAASVREVGLGAEVEFTGALRGPQLVEQYAWADAYVQPSLREGFGVAIVEALATGLPVVATDSGGPVDIVTADNGSLVAPGDPDVLADAIVAMAGRLGEFDRQRIADGTRERFGPQAVGEQLVELYRRVAGVEPRG
jgi:glycosyltransferase involved in cell wall biosynthesis